MGISDYDREKKRWKDDDDGLYAYALYDVTEFSFQSYPYIFAHNFAEAMKSVATMISDGVERVEVGLPNGEYIVIDARHTDAVDAVSEDNDSERG